MSLQHAGPASAPRAVNGTALRADFPALAGPTRDGHRLAFLDSAASSLKPQAVIDAIADLYAHHYANVHRGIYELSEDATARYEAARTRVAAFIGAASGREVVFVRNATEAINLVAYSWGDATVDAGDIILATQMEHHANLVPWQQLAARRGAAVEYVAVTDDGRLDLDDLRERLTHGPRLLAVTHVSNVLGTINPIAEIVELAHAAGALVLLDAAQSVPHAPVDVTALGIDFAAFSAHKMLGPSGIGVLWARRTILEAMPPFMTGGNMISRVTLERTEFAEVPGRFEAGTPAIAEAVGLAAAIDYLDALGMAAVRAHERDLFTAAWEALTSIRGVQPLGPADPELHGGAISFVVDGIHPHDVASVLDAHGVAVRAGHHCAQPLMDRFGVPATTRASLYVYNDLDDIERLVTAIRGAQQLFGQA